ncbi:MAG: hypothetical protein DRQ13_02575, partial [Ignavibacteriae bacterium]
MPKYFSYTLIILIFSLCFTFGQGDPVSQPQVSQSVYHDTSPPLWELVATPVTESQWDDGMVPLLINSPQYNDQYEYDPALQNFHGTNNDGFIVRNWDGVSAQSYAPPDMSGAVGPNHYMEMTNVRFQIWNKTGTSLLGPSNLGAIWAGFPGPWASSLNDGDPIVLYDEAADRFMASQFSLPNYPNGPFYMLIAISQTGDPTGSWHRYGFSFSAMPDYPKFGVWPDGYYMSANSFSGNFIGAIAVAFERSQMLNGNAAQMVSFQRSSTTTWSLLPSDWNSTTTPPAGAPNYFGQIHDNARYGGTDGFDIYQFHVDWVAPGNSTFAGPTFLITSPFSGVSGIPQPSPGATLDDLSVMTMNRLDYRNFGLHQSMVVCHTVNAGGGVAGMRWYEFRNTGANWSLFQQGTYSPDGTDRWMGSVAMNANGDICLGYSASSTSVMPEIRYTGRFSGDPSGVMTIAEETIFSSSGVQTGLQRWGDYTQMSVDPAEPDVFWYVNQYQPSTGSFNWHTRIASIDFNINPDELTSFTATAISDSQIDIAFTPNASNNNVVIVYNLTGTFTEPIGSPPTIGQPFAGGTLLYNGITSPVNHTGLNEQTDYYYKAFSYNGTSYSSGLTANTQTIDNTDFTANFLIFDNCANSQNLEFGTAPAA